MQHVLDKPRFTNRPTLLRPPERINDVCGFVVSCSERGHGTCCSQCFRCRDEVEPCTECYMMLDQVWTQRGRLEHRTFPPVARSTMCLLECNSVYHAVVTVRPAAGVQEFTCLAACACIARVRTQTARAHTHTLTHSHVHTYIHTYRCLYVRPSVPACARACVRAMHAYPRTCTAFGITAHLVRNRERQTDEPD